MVTEGLHELVLSLIPLTKEPKRIVNLGCEDFHQKSYKIPENYTVYNCDIDPAKAGAPNFTLCDLNKEPYPYKDDFADVVLSVEVIEHLENPWLHLREIKRILKRNGMAIITTPNILSPESRRLFLETGYFVWFKPENIDRYPYHSCHINPIPKWELEYICKRIGLKIEKVICHPPDTQINLVMVLRKP